jgi:hypothetical protein
MSLSQKSFNFFATCESLAMTDSVSNGYVVHPNWSARRETPDELAARFLRLIDGLRALDPAFSVVECGPYGTRRFEDVRDIFATVVDEGVMRLDDGTILRSWGYGFGAVTRAPSHAKHFAVRVHAGAGRTGWAVPNDVVFMAYPGTPPDPACVSYAFMRDVMRVMVDVWEPDFCDVYPDALLPLIETAHLSPNWMVYLHPNLAGRIDRPVDLPVVEPTPDGGLVLAAVMETFDVENPAHMAAARRLGDAVAPLNVLYPRGVNPDDAEFEP